jgi:hypothetical protein
MSRDKLIVKKFTINMDGMRKPKMVNMKPINERYTKLRFNLRTFYCILFPQQVRNPTFARCTKIVGTCLVIIVDDFVNKLRDTLAVFLQSIERILDRLINSFLNVLAHIFNLICTSNQLKARKYGLTQLQEFT